MYDGVKIFVNSTFLELYKSDKSPLVHCLYILFKKTQPLSKGESVTILLCDQFFLIRMCFEFDLIVKLKLETLPSAKFVLKGKPFLYPTEVQKEWLLLLLCFFCVFFPLSAKPADEHPILFIIITRQKG